MIILGIESSCDETAAAVLKDGNTLLANVVDSQIDIHSIYGGVVPELASRRHLETIYPVVNKALNSAEITLKDINGIAVTQGPGLIGSLLVGFSFAKALAFVSGIPFVGVDHMAGHLLSVNLGKEQPEFPYIALIASGGHSSLYFVSGPLSYKQLGQTRDDAAGEAFDKVAKLLNLGYPGGPIISKMAENGNPKAISFPRAWLEPDKFDFSFSGLKTSVVNYVNRMKQTEAEMNVADICASFQEAVVEVLVEKSIQAARKTKVNAIILAGGVGANKRLRLYLQQRGTEENMKIYLPPIEFCTDNAAMIALAGHQMFLENRNSPFDLDVYSRVHQRPAHKNKELQG